MKTAGGVTDDDYYDDYYHSNSNDYGEEEEEIMHEMLVDDWYDLVRYLVGLGLCIFGLIGMYFHQFASYYFLKRYTRPRFTERRIGRVISCEPLLISTVIHSKKKKKKRKKKTKDKKDKSQGVPVPTFRGEDAGNVSSITDYVREEDLEQLSNGDSDRSFTEYRMLVAYNVPKAPTRSLLCCGPAERSLTLSCANSFAVASCGSGLSDTDSIMEAVKTYRSRSLPPPLSPVPDYSNINKLSEKISMDYMNRNEHCEYFQWFETSKPQPIDADIDLILLKGKPTSACTQEVIGAHLEQVGKSHDGKEKDMYCKSISMLGTGLLVAVIVLTLVCVFEIQAMPNPETQRPLGYTVLGSFFFGSVMFAYLFAKLLFEQYKQKVFLSAFTVPSTPVRRRTSTSDSATSAGSDGIVCDDDDLVIIPRTR
jgi:hypothetical protein